MSDPKPPIGSIAWCDLTVPDADDVRDFYQEVVGWSAVPVDMGDYSDYAMSPPDSATPTAGVCWARGVNAGLPAAWLLYFTVASLEASLAKVKEAGGTVVGAPRGSGFGRFAVVRDPAGAVCALFEPSGE